MSFDDFPGSRLFIRYCPGAKGGAFLEEQAVDAEDIRKIVAGYQPATDLQVEPLLKPWDGTLTPRERFRRVMNFEPTDRTPNYEFGWWKEVFPVWQAQGMSSAVTDITKGNVYFGFDPQIQLGAKLTLNPPFERRTLKEESDGRKIIVDGDGVTCEVFSDDSSSIPHYLDWSLKTPADWQRFKERLDPNDPNRVPAGLKEKFAAVLKDRTAPAGIYFGSLPGWVRNWMGFEGICTAVYDYPEMMADIFNRMTDVIVAVLEKVLPGTDFDFAFGWEDITFNSGPILSPDYFRAVILPCYKRVTEVLHRHGIETIFTDSDGDVTLLTDIWLEAGINTLFPVERAGETDPVKIRAKYGKKVRIIGGVDKKALGAGREAIKRELEYLAPVVYEGGFIPHVDHRVPPDVSYEDYLYYLDVKKQLFGTPKPC